MSLTPTDDPETRRSTGRNRAPEDPATLSSRERVRFGLVDLQRRLQAGKRSVVDSVRAGLNRLFSPGLVQPETEPLDDRAPDPPSCPSIDRLPPRAFPSSYPTRAYHFVENDVDLVAEAREDALTISHPDVDESWLQSDTWTRVRR